MRIGIIKYYFKFYTKKLNVRITQGYKWGEFVNIF